MPGVDESGFTSVSREETVDTQTLPAKDEGRKDAEFIN